MLLNVINYNSNLQKMNFQEDGSETKSLFGVKLPVSEVHQSKFTLDYDSQITDKYFLNTLGLEVQQSLQVDTLSQHLGNVKKSVAERTRHQRQLNRMQDDNSSQGIDTDLIDAENRPIYDEEPMTEVGLTRHRFSPNKTSAVSEKTSPRSDLRWKPTGRIFKTVGLRWIPTGKLFDSCTSKIDSEPPHGSNVDIPHIHECKQTLDVSAGTSINVQKEQSLDLSAEVHQAAETVTTSNELDVLFGPLFDEYFNRENQVVLKSSAVTTTDASNKRQQHPDSNIHHTSTLATTALLIGNWEAEGD
ncbi:hypothetical protein Tco_0625065 [Tanacetum coccineum]|uniref:Uncharacterized protein n=1 Tax=Tanacetum coccineum TaxID=301880 RepID=A0ABQ4WFR4_9ASTR